jgi:putative tryptophan/tyrosine transport system substrate-binding protein
VLDWVTRPRGRPHEATRLHHACWRGSGRFAACFACAAAGPDAAGCCANGLVATFRGGLSKLGWTEGSNLRIEVRWAGGDVNKVRTLALVGLRPDVILSQVTVVTDVLARETKTIPIVFVTAADPVASGFTTSLARPGGNITGFTAFEPTLAGKWVELLKEIAPHTVRVALLSNQATGGLLQFYMPSIQAAASSLAVQVNTAPVHAKDEI